MIVNLIRHGYTQGNLEKRYIGITDEPLCQFGIDSLKTQQYPPCDRVYCSPMLRCIQTANIVYPDRDITIVQDFKECNFGDFEGKNYLELSGNADYQAWIDSNGTMPFPSGESREDFSERSYMAFKKLVNSCKCEAISLVVHGGTIMAIMERLDPTRNYFDFQIKNGQYITTQL